MGESERIPPDLGELVRVAANLSPERRAELVDFATFLAAREQRGNVGGEMTDEDRAWMDADLSNLAAWEPYDWGPSGPPKGRPVIWDEERAAFVIEDDADAR